MCNGSPTLRKRRSIADGAAPPSSTHHATHDSRKVPLASEHESPHSSHHYTYTHNGIFRSPKLRKLLLPLSILFLLTILALLRIQSTRQSNIKRLSDQILTLTQQLHAISTEDEDALRQISQLQSQLTDKNDAIATFQQNRAFIDQDKDAMKHDMLGEIRKDMDVMKGFSETLREVEDVKHIQERQVSQTKGDNAKLKVQLAIAIEELMRERKQLPAAPGSGVGGGGGGMRQGGESRSGSSSEVRKKMLRAKGTYLPGDNVEIMEREADTGKMVLYPGIVSDVNSDHTYNIVKVASSILVKDVPTSRFRTYQYYLPGTHAYLQIPIANSNTAEEEKNTNSNNNNNNDNLLVPVEYVPVTIIEFLVNSARVGMEIHGYYQTTMDGDTEGAIREERAMRLHRYVEEGEIWGEDGDGADL